MKILCLDIEGGYGGSSRSLFESLRYRTDIIAPEVWCRRDGPAQDRYRSIDVASRVTADMPHISSLPLLSRNVYVYGKFILGWHRSNAFRAEIARRLRSDFDLVHFNHEGLFLLARWLRRKLGRQVAMTAHVRTRLPINAFTKWQYRTLADAVDGTIFISEMERDQVRRLVGRDVPGKVIYNIVSNDDEMRPDPELEADARFKIGSTDRKSVV